MLANLSVCDPTTFGEPCSLAPGGLSLLEGLGPQTGDLIVQAMALDVQHMFEENLLWNVVDLAYECLWWIRFQQSFHVDRWMACGPCPSFYRRVGRSIWVSDFKMLQTGQQPDLVNRKGYKPDGCSPSPSTSLAFTCSVNESIPIQWCITSQLYLAIAKGNWNTWGIFLRTCEQTIGHWRPWVFEVWTTDVEKRLAGVEWVGLHTDMYNSEAALLL